MEMDMEIFDFNFDFPQHLERVPRRYIRDARNPLEWWSNEFVKRYRFKKESVTNFILPTIFNNIEIESKRGLPVPPILQILVFLRFCATASFQIVCGDLYDISQGTVSNIIARVSSCIAQERRNFIKFPPQNMMEENKHLFMELGRIGTRNGIPGVIGAIDCTHIKIVNTPKQQHHESFRNRKGFFSLNIQAVAGPRGEFCDIVARWAGSLHDSRIFQMSRLYARLTGNLDGILLGDNGYACYPFLMTPILQAQGEPDQRYNRAHIKARNVVERTFGVWKRRFPCLTRGMGNKLETVCNIIISCAVLHNMGIMLNDDYEDFENYDENDNVEVEIIRPQPGEGMIARCRIVNIHFS